MSLTPQFITPPSEEELIYPYRRVWSTIGIEGGIFTAAVFAGIVLAQFAQFAENVRFVFDMLLTLLPVMLWAYFSWTRENFVQEPRKRLLPVATIAALTANAVGYPLVYNMLDIDSWVTQTELAHRVVIYALALGIIPETLKYLVLRYTVWLNHLRNRYDSIAYSVTAAIAYATVLNAHYLFASDTAPQPDIAAIRVFSVVAMQISGSLIVAYGLAEIRLGKPSSLLMPGMIAAASLIIGVVYTLRGNIGNTRLTLAISSPRTLLSLIITALLWVAVAMVMVFLFNTVERQTEEAQQDTQG
jgi:hypothetical protein